MPCAGKEAIATAPRSSTPSKPPIPAPPEAGTEQCRGEWLRLLKRDSYLTCHQGLSDQLSPGWLGEISRANHGISRDSNWPLPADPPRFPAHATAPQKAKTRAEPRLGGILLFEPHARTKPDPVGHDEKALNCAQWEANAVHFSRHSGEPFCGTGFVG
ncbi:hypothetical protein FQN53_005941 [Emmonsiellopsis sp. PD_33]|nr:hypothetical protein FQN53_005941 [Emmonsiellopsis sp. PD_33]